MLGDFTEQGVIKTSQFDATIQIRCGHVEPPYREFILTSIQRIAFSSAIATVLAAAPFAAQAGSYASASVGQLSFQLIDLDATDGILPSYTLNPGPGVGVGVGSGSTAGTTASVSATDNNLGWSDSASKTRNSLFYPLSLDAAAGKASAHAEVTSTAVSAQGSAAGQGTSFNASASTNAGQNYYYNSIYAIDLSPRSVLLVTARVDASAWAGNAQCSPSTYYGMTCGTESSSANAGMNLSYSYNSSGVSASYSFNDSASVSAQASGSYGYGYDPKTGYYGYISYPGLDQSKSSGKWLTAVFTNSTAFTQQATLGLTSNVSGYATTAIPEASTTAMFALGLLGLVGVARRRA